MFLGVLVARNEKVIRKSFILTLHPHPIESNGFRKLCLARCSLLSSPSFFKYPLQFSRSTDTELEPRFMTKCLLSTRYDYASLYKAKRWEKGSLLPERGLQRTEAQEEAREWSLEIGCGLGLGCLRTICSTWAFFTAPHAS